MTHQLICNMLRVESGTQIAPRFLWEWTTYAGRSFRTLIHFMAQTGMRKAEVTLPGGEQWGKKHISFANLKWFIKGEYTASPRADQLWLLTEGDYAVVTPPPSKSDPFGIRWGTKPIWLPYHPTAAINAARALAEWEMLARVSGEQRCTTPLFWGLGAWGTPLKEAEAMKFFDGLLLAALKGDKEQVKLYTMHSFRSYLASAIGQ